MIRKQEDVPSEVILTLPTDECNSIATSVIHSQTSSSSSHSSSSRRRRVRFCEKSLNEYHDSAQTLIDPSLWYNLDDFEAFRFDARQTAAKLQASTDPHSWSNSLMRVYFTLRVANTMQEVQQVVDETNVSLDETTLGLQDHHLHPICADYLVRRQHLLQQILGLQESQRGGHNRSPHHNNRLYSHHKLETLIQQTSLLSSHAARMYASYVAQNIR